MYDLTMELLSLSHQLPSHVPSIVDPLSIQPISPLLTFYTCTTPLTFLIASFSCFPSFSLTPLPLPFLSSSAASFLPSFPPPSFLQGLFACLPSRLHLIFPFLLVQPFPYPLFHFYHFLFLSAFLFMFTYPSLTQPYPHPPSGSKPRVEVVRRPERSLVHLLLFEQLDHRQGLSRRRHQHQIHRRQKALHRSFQHHDAGIAQGCSCHGLYFNTLPQA